MTAPAPVRYGDRGPAVLELQRALVELLGPGALPRYGADGSLGAEGWAALERAADHYRIDPLAPPARGAIVWPDLVDALLGGAEDDDAPALTATPECSGLSCEAIGGHRLYDLRRERVASRPAVRMDGPGRPHVRRPEDVLGILYHQTGIDYGLSPAQLRAAGGDRDLALAQRGLLVSAHATVFHGRRAGASGPIISIAAPLLWHVNHAHGANSCSIGLETEGDYPGLAGDRSRAWTPWTEEHCQAVRAAIRWIVEQAAREGAHLRYGWAHRQSKGNRVRDPGELFWKDVADWARRELGLAWQPERTWGDGRPLAREWGAVDGAPY